MILRDVNISGRNVALLLAALFVWTPIAAKLHAQSHPVMQAEAERLMALANRARAAAGASPLKWDSALAEAARKHTMRMVAEGPIAHRYPGELDLSERAGLAGAHFDLVEENIAIGPSPEQIQDEWMHSKGHRENMLNREVDRVGIAVIESRGVLYATEDFARGVNSYSKLQAEERVAALIRPSGVKVVSSPYARSACEMNNGIPRSGGDQPSFVMRWQDSDLSRLPKQLQERLASRQYREAAVGSCEPIGVDGTFTAYRMAVLLY